MSDVDAIVKEARLLQRGDVVAVSTRGLRSEYALEQLRAQLVEIYEATGVNFVFFEDVDFEVFRPVPV